MLDTSSLNTHGDQRIAKINSKSIKPITKLGTIYALWGLKTPQKTVVRLNICLCFFLLTSDLLNIQQYQKEPRALLCRK